jgi:hypothetical protein
MHAVSPFAATSQAKVNAAVNEMINSLRRDVIALISSRNLADTDRFFLPVKSQPIVALRTSNRPDLREFRRSLYRFPRRLFYDFTLFFDGNRELALVGQAVLRTIPAENVPGKTRIVRLHPFLCSTGKASNGAETRLSASISEMVLKAWN